MIYAGPIIPAPVFTILKSLGKNNLILQAKTKSSNLKFQIAKMQKIKS